MITKLKAALLHAVVTLIIGCVPARRSEWAAAMVCEIYHIENYWKSLLFAIGCVQTIQFERLKEMRKFDAGRLISFLFASGWGLMKITFAIFFFLPQGGIDFQGGLFTTAPTSLGFSIGLWQFTSILISGLAFLGAGYSLLKWKQAHIVGFLGAAFLANTMTAAILSASILFLDTAAMALWSFAIVVEEYAALTALLFGAFTTWRFSLQKSGV